MSYASAFLRYCRSEFNYDCSAALQQVLIEAGFANFDVLDREYVVEAELVNDSLLSVGSGVEELYSTIDNPIVRVRSADGRIVPVIPGSTLKGVLRSIAERIVASRGLLCISPPRGLVDRLDRCRGEIDVGRLRCTGEGLAEVEKLLRTCCRELVEFLEGGGGEFVDKCLLSPVVGLFGAPWLASHLVFYDALPVDWEEAAIEVIRRVAIDRFTLSQKPGLLYSLEAIRPGVTWRFRLRIVNVDIEDGGGDERVKLFWDVMRVLKEGIAVGRRTSVGHGVLKLKTIRSCTKYVVEKGVLKTEDCTNLFRERLGV